MTDEFIGKVIAEKYRVDSILRDSDLGSFYYGWHMIMDRPVALKILPRSQSMDPRRIKQFLSEAKAIASVSHPHILNVTDFGTDHRSISYTIFEPAAGDTLQAVISRDGPLTVPQTLTIAKQTAEALAAAHSKGIVHCGLTSQKILVSKVDDGDEAKVFDFGVQPIESAGGADLAYLAPEQYGDTSFADERSDVYAMGVVLYEMLSGEVPFPGQTLAEIKFRQEGPPKQLSLFRKDLPANLEPMILTALAADPERRYQKMDAFAEDLGLLLTGASKPAAAAAAAGRNIWQTAFIVLAGIIVLAGALIYATSVRHTNPTLTTQVDPASLPVQPIGPATGAQEESLAKLPDMTEAEIIAAGNSNTALPPGSLPGGDGYNAWSNGGTPLLGAPPAQYVPPGGQQVTIPGDGSSPFMPSDIPPGCTMLPSGLILCPSPLKPEKPSPTPNKQSTNANTGTGATPLGTPKAAATPTPKT